MKKIYLLVTAAILLGAVGCTESEDGTPTVRIAPTIETRVTGVHFDASDCIGLTIMRASGAFVENRMMSYNGTAFTASGLLWYNDANEKSTLTAYYPYAEGGMPVEFTVASDQRAGCASSDLLAAVKTDVTPVSAPVAMRFRHLLSQLTVVATNQSDAHVSQIRIGGTVPVADVDFASLTAQAKTGAAVADVVACEVEADTRYRAILVPQEADLTVTVETADGKSRSKTVSGAILTAGKQYDLAVVVTNVDISVTLSGDIEDWGEGGSLGGDTPATLEYGGTTYRTEPIGTQVWMVENLRYMPADATLGNGVWNPAGGAAAVETQGFLYDYATATGGMTVALDQAPVRGICPEGWHIPDAAELAELKAAAGEFFHCAGYWKYSASGGSYGPAEKGYLLSMTTPESGRCSCLMYGKDVTPEVVSLNANYGVSLRCVRDTAE